MLPGCALARLLEDGLPFELAPLSLLLLLRDPVGLLVEQHAGSSSWTAGRVMHAAHMMTACRESVGLLLLFG